MPFVIHYLQFVLVSLLIIFLVWAGIRTAWKSRFWRQTSRVDAAALTCCLLLALIARSSARIFPDSFMLASVQGLVIGGAHHWGAGFSAVLHFLYLFFPADVATVARMNVLVSVATVPVLFAFVDAYFKDRLAAFGAAAVFACHPVLVRWAASDSAHVLLTFCLFAACLCLALWSASGKRLVLLQAAGWLALAANVRLEAVSYALVGGLILAGGAPRMAKGKPGDLRDAGLLYVMLTIYPAWQVYVGLSPQGQVDDLAPLGFMQAFFLSKYSSTFIAVLAIVGTLGALMTRFRQALAFLLALIVVSLPTEFHDVFDELHRSVLPHLAAWCVFAGHGLSAAIRLLARCFKRAERADSDAEMRRLTPLGAAAVLAVVLWAAAPHRSFLHKTWTHALEYEFIMDHLGAIPDGCVIVAPESIREDEARGLRLQPSIFEMAGRKHSWLSIDEMRNTRIEPCTVFYRGTSCFAFETSRHQRKPWTGAERPVCREFEAQFSLEPLAAATILAIPYSDETYVVNPIPVGFYYLRAKPSR